MSDLATQAQVKRDQLRWHLAEAWKLEAELNALHRAMGQSGLPYGELLPKPGLRLRPLRGPHARGPHA